MANSTEEILYPHEGSDSGSHRYKQIINSITDYIYSVRFDEFGNTNTIHTPTCFIITGYSIKDFDANPNLWIQIVHDEDKARLLQFIDKIASHEEENIIEHRIWNKSGKIIWIQNTIIKYFDAENRFVGYDGVITDITDRKINAEQLRLSEQKFRGVFNLSPDALLLSDAETGRVYDFNKMFLSEFEYTEAEIKGIKNDFDLTIVEDWHLIVSEIRANKKLIDHEVWRLSGNGVRNTYIISASTIQVSHNNYILYQFRNISKRKKLEYVLRFIGQRGSLSDGTRFFNDLALFLSDLLGVDHVVIGQSVPENIHRSEVMVLLSKGQFLENNLFDLDDFQLNELIHKSVFICEKGFRNMFPNSRFLAKWEIESYVGVSLSNYEGLASGYIALLNKEPFQDLADYQELLQIVALRVSHEMENMRHLAKIAEYREHLEDLVVLRTTELENTIQALNIAKIRAESASNAKSSFLSSMSHELRTPLNAILGYAASLQKESNINVKQKLNLQTIESSGQHLLSIINEILDYSKIEAGKVAIEKMDFNLNNLLYSTLDMTKHKAWEKKLDFIYMQESALPEIVNGDEKRIRQIFLNLITNAIKYTAKGSVILRIKFGTPSKNILYFEVEDTGAGIAEENFSKIFEPFTQLHEQRSYIEGTGLGLSITKNLVELMRGRIYFKSSLNKGSTFFVEIPLQAILFRNETSLNIDLRNDELSDGVKAPEEEILRQIIHSAKTGNFTLVESVISEILSKDESYSRFCNIIREHSNKYSDDDIVSFCSQFLRK